MDTAALFAAKAANLVVVIIAQYHLIIANLVNNATEGGIRDYLSSFDQNEVQDSLDGVGAVHGRQVIPMEERFWERVGRNMPSKKLQDPLPVHVSR